jgi:RecA-family ATPase
MTTKKNKKPSEASAAAVVDAVEAVDAAAAAVDVAAAAAVDAAAPLEAVENSKERLEAVTSDLLMPTLGELLKLDIPERQCLLNPWLREHESCLLYAATGVGKSLFALSAALAVAGNGSFLKWRPDPKPDGTDWRVLYVDGEQHIGDIQERARLLMEAVPDISRTKAQSNLQFLARQQQDPTVDFPEITDANQGGGQERILEKVLDGKFNLLILDNFSTLGIVEDENDASSFNAIQSFLLRLKTENVATILVHHTGKSGETYRGSTKLAATFEIMLHLKRYAGDVKQRGRIDTEAADYGQAHFELEWHKLRSQRAVGKVVAKLTTRERQGLQVAYWDFERSLDRLYAVKEALEAGLFRSKSEMAAACGLHRSAAQRIIDKGIKYRVWTDANINPWLAKGQERRRAGETTAPTKASTPVAVGLLDDDDEDDL